MLTLQSFFSSKVPDSLKIFLGQGSTIDNSHALQTTTALSFNEDNRIKITAKDDGIITLYINDKVAGSMYVPLSTRPPFGEISVHASDPFYPAANAVSQFFHNSQYNPTNLTFNLCNK